MKDEKGIEGIDVEKEESKRKRKANVEFESMVHCAEVENRMIAVTDETEQEPANNYEVIKKLGSDLHSKLGRLRNKTSIIMESIKGIAGSCEFEGQTQEEVPSVYDVGVKYETGETAMDGNALSISKMASEARRRVVMAKNIIESQMSNLKKCIIDQQQLSSLVNGDAVVVVLCPYLLKYEEEHGTRNYLKSFVTFSRSCIEIKCTNSCGNESFISEWDISHISRIEHQWFLPDHMVLLKIFTKTITENQVEDVNDDPGLLELEFTFLEIDWAETRERINLLDERYMALWKPVLNNDTWKLGFGGESSSSSPTHFSPNVDEPFEGVIYPQSYPDMISSFEDEEIEWMFEADMLSSFEEYPELCVRAVCALHRLQLSKDLILYKGLFSETDAHRIATLAEFLMDEEDCKGDVKKSIKELETLDSKAVEDCKRLARSYTKQLFSVYQNGKDPFFLPATK